MSAEVINFVLAQAQQRLDEATELRAILKNRLDEVEAMLGELKAERSRDQPPPRPHLQLVK